MSPVAPDRPQPAIPAAERALLSCVLQSPQDCLLAVRDRLRDAQPFNDAKHAMIWRAIIALADASRPIDLRLVLSLLTSKGVIAEAGGEEYVTAVYTDLPTTVNALQYADEVMNAHMLRCIIRSSTDWIAAAFDSGLTADAILDRMANDLTAISDLRVAPPAPSMRDHCLRALAEMEATRAGTATWCPWCYEPLDRWSRLKRNRLVLVAARPGIGKSALKITVMLRQGLTGVAAGALQMELDDAQWTNRLLAQLSGIPYTALDAGLPNATPLHLQDYQTAMDRATALPLHVECPGSLSWPQARDKARRMREINGVRCLWIDHVGMITPTRFYRDPNQWQADLAVHLDKLTDDLGIPIIALAHLNRYAADDVPSASHLAGSDAWFKYADSILLLDRPDQDRPGSKDRPYSKAGGDRYTREDLTGKIVLLSGKNRGGPPMLHVTDYNGPLMLIGDPPDDQPRRRDVDPANIPPPTDRTEAANGRDF